MANRSRSFKKKLDFALSGSAMIFIISVLFVPIHYFSYYIYWVAFVGIASFIISLPFELYYFVKDTPKRKWGKHRPKKDERMVWVNKKEGVFVLVS